MQSDQYLDYFALVPDLCTDQYLDYFALHGPDLPVCSLTNILIILHLGLIYAV